MGTVVSYFRSPNEPDSVTGLTPREKQFVTSTWSIVKKDLTGNGVQLFMMFFKRKPEYQNYFPFRDIPIEELESSPKLKAHAASVMYAISSVVDNLDNTDVLINILQKTGESHARRKIPAESFHLLKGILLEFLEVGLGPKINKEGLDAWDKTLVVAFKVILDSLKPDAQD